MTVTVLVVFVLQECRIAVRCSACPTESGLGRSAQITGNALSKVFALLTDLDFFIIGSGTAPWRPPDPLRARFHEGHVALDSMTTGPAVRTYNVMLMEGRRVGAGLIAID